MKAVPTLISVLSLTVGPRWLLMVETIKLVLIPNLQGSTVENTIANAGGEVGISSSDSSTSGTFGTLHFGNNTDSSLASIRGKADGSTSAGKRV